MTQQSELRNMIANILAGHGIQSDPLTDHMVEFIKKFFVTYTEASAVFLEDIDELQQDVDALLVAVEDERAVSDRLAEAINRFMSTQQGSHTYTVKIGDDQGVRVVPADSTVAYDALVAEHRAYLTLRQQDAA